jgi:predicted DNA repair protein MutK
MPSASLLALLDDIASILDDVALLTKVAAKKTAGVLGDDLALNAEQVSGVRAERELPVVWAVAKGSMVNKAILVPAALLISAFAPWAIVPLLMVGGGYLCYEGFEKVLHSLFRRKHHGAAAKPTTPEPATPILGQADVRRLESETIRGAVRTDFVLSAEIVTISLGSVASVAFLTRVLVLSTIAILMTVGVYGFVAMIVKMDDLGVYLYRQKERNRLGAGLGRAILWVAPRMMKSLTVIGTVAMFLVGGGIMVHGIGPLEHLIQGWTTAAQHFGGVVSSLAGGLVGVVAGGLVFAVVLVGEKALRRR